MAYELAEAVTVLRPYVIRVTFRDGSVREIDVEDRLSIPVFEDLKDAAFFAKAVVHLGVITWPNGVDLAPDRLYGDGREISPPKKRATAS